MEPQQNHHIFPSVLNFPPQENPCKQGNFTSNPELVPQYRAASRRRFAAPTSLLSSRCTTSPTSKIQGQFQNPGKSLFFQGREPPYHIVGGSKYQSSLSGNYRTSLILRMVQYQQKYLQLHFPHVKDVHKSVKQ